jgi:hypothetical protein
VALKFSPSWVTQSKWWLDMLCLVLVLSWFLMGSPNSLMDESCSLSLRLLSTMLLLNPLYFLWQTFVSLKFYWVPFVLTCCFLLVLLPVASMMTTDFSRVIRLGMGRDMDATHLYSGHLWPFVLLFILEYCFSFFVYCLMTFVMYPFAKLDLLELLYFCVVLSWLIVMMLQFHRFAYMFRLVHVMLGGPPRFVAMQSLAETIKTASKSQGITKRVRCRDALITYG